jgi:hypothetical protein
MEFVRRSIRSHSLEKSFWKRLRSFPMTEFVMILMTMTMTLHMPGTINTNEMEGSYHQIRSLIFVLETSGLRMFQETSSGDNIVEF